MIHVTRDDLSTLGKLFPESLSSNHKDDNDNHDEWTHDFSIPIEISLGHPSALQQVQAASAPYAAHLCVGRSSPFFFDAERFPSTATFDCCSLCLVHPRVLKDSTLIYGCHISFDTSMLFMCIPTPIFRRMRS
jgi:hypothetical protein